MSKRKREKCDDEFIRKLRRLEERYFCRNNESSADEFYDSENDRGARSVSPSSPPSPSADFISEEVALDTEQQAQLEGPAEDASHRDPAVALVAAPVPNTLTAEDQAGPSIPQEVLALLGVARQVEAPLGEKISTEISERWGKILSDGLEKSQRDKLLATMLIPENFLLAQAPKLNLEVASVLTESVKNRDKRLEAAQNQLGTGIAGLANLTQNLINADMYKLEIIKKLSEVSQVLLDLHHEESINRRRLIVPLLDKNFWSIAKGVKREQYLFGDKLGESIKSSKIIEKSSQQIRKPSTSAFRRPFQQSQQAQQGNLRAPPRQASGPRPSFAPPRRGPPAPAPRRPAPAQARAPPTARARSADQRTRR